MAISDFTKCRENGIKVLVGLFSLLVLFSVWMICPVKACANPPKEVTLAHDGETRKLTVTIVHESSFPNYHYIKKIEIRRNGMPAGFFAYESQPDKAKFSYSYDVPGVKGDVIEVTASCSLYGSKTVSMTIGM